MALALVLAGAIRGADAATESRALVVPQGGGAGFESVEPAATGVIFTNALPVAAALQNQNLLNGSGVAAGDFDGDGRCDLYFCAIQGTNALYRNLGNWRFEDVTAAAGVGCGGNASTGAVFADVEGDGDLDLLVSSLGRGVRLFVNQGAGKFTESTAAAGLTSNTGSTSLVLGDVEGDGDLDLYVANYGAMSVLRSGGRAEVKRVNGEWVVTGPHAARLRYVDGRMEEVGEADVLYLNDGKGRFQPVEWGSDRFASEDGSPKAAPLDYGLAVQMRDLTGDGAPEIYVCNDYQTPDRLWVNDGKGRFREAPHRALRKFPFSSMGVDFGDLDRDGHLDAFVVEMASRDHSRHLRQLSGVVPIPNLPGRFEARPQVLRNVLYHGNGDGTWSDVAEASGLVATDWSWQGAFLDVDLDGYEDVLVGNGMLFDMLDRDAPARIQALGKQSPESARTNLLQYPSFLSPNAAYRNRGDMTFEDRSASWGFDSTRISQGLAFADLDGDGDLDVAVNALQEGALLYRNRGHSPRLAVRLKGRAPNVQGVGARVFVRGGPVDQQQEILAGGRYLSADEAVRTFACGASTGLVVEVRWRSGSVSVISNALPNHAYLIDESESVPWTPPPRPRGTAWFADASARLSHQHTEPVFDDFTRQPLLARQLSTAGPAVAWADLDGDGHAEALVATGRGGRLGAFTFLPGGAPKRIETGWVAPDDVVAFTAGAAADGRPAVIAAVSNYESAEGTAPALVQITWAGGVAPLAVEAVAGMPALDGNPGALASVDVDGDGDLDLFVGGHAVPGKYPRASASRLFRRQANGWEEDRAVRPLLEAVGLVSSATWVDLEDDGFPELVLAIEWGAPRIFRNNRGTLSAWDPEADGWSGGKARARLSERSGWWTSVTAGDWNEDGRLDLAFGNWGWNTGYLADPEHPLRLHHGSQGSGGTYDLIETLVDPGTGREVPRRSLVALGRAFPPLMGRFPNHKAYGEGTAAEVLSVLPVRPEVVSAVDLSSVVLWSGASGWRAQALPREVQWAPAFGLAMTDADGDGHDDLFVAQNFFAMRIEWPRTDAGRGVWLKGDGRGGFEALGVQSSGVLMLGEGRGAAIGDNDRDGAPDLMVGQNGFSTALWRNRSAAGRRWLRMDLVGPPGNPRGVGATIQWGAPGRWGARREIRGSTGYRSVDESVFRGVVSEADRGFRMRLPGGREVLGEIPKGAEWLRVTWDGAVNVVPR